MSSNSGPEEFARIVAVVVLYRMRAEESPAFCSLTHLLSRPESALPGVEMVVFDNSPQEQLAPDRYSGRYLRNPSNPGLARCYNQALQIASERNVPWILLLDQDTTLTAHYLREVNAAINLVDSHSEVVAVVPRLTQAGMVCSPILPPTYGPARPIDSTISGVVQDQLHVFNSGAVLRVAAMESIGGFPEQFPLDFLDHATFAELQRRSGRIFVLHATLAHDLSSNDEWRRDEAFVRRQESVLDAEYRFYNRYGTRQERILRRFRLMRACAGRVLRGKGGGQTWRMLKSAIRP